ncbi:uncharacterized protein LOC125240466 [Leguminivora glycinivorella]|uniref:uncharacterized protein LOC125240466 n=1 Tax=Leguminivora glycinivorella TaxID=1035111 RepID=UPI00200F9C0C|nr:uncharacterized protein LOC125240466 [Leguminivora glycinivorella]
MDGNEKEKPPDEDGDNGMDWEKYTRKRNLDLSPTKLEPSPKKIVIDPAESEKQSGNTNSAVEEPGTSRMVESHANSQKESVEINKSNSTEFNPHLYKHPSLDSKSREYGANDDGPFIVHVSREAAPSSSATLKPINVGLLLTRANVNNIQKDGGIKSVGRNRVAVTFSTAADANNFLKHPLLGENKFIADIPSYHVSRMGVVRGVPSDWTMEELVNGTSLREGKGKILKARRLQRKILKDDGSPSWVPTQSVVVTFEGQSLPAKIFAYYTSLVVDVYQLPIIQCRKCLRFGHIQAQCRSDARCYKCSQKHPGDGCNIAPEHVRCIFCSGRHYATDKTCNEFGRQKAIKLAMSEQSISYAEAAAQFSSVRRPYSDVARVMFEQIPDSSRSSESPCHTFIPTSPPTTSYRKTIYRAPRARVPSPQVMTERPTIILFVLPHHSSPMARP